MVKSVIALQLIPLLGAVLVLFFPRKKAGLAGIFAIIVSLLELAAAIRILPFRFNFNMPLGMGIFAAFNFDKLSALTVIILSSATLIAVLYSLKSRQSPEQTPLLYSLFLFVLFGTTGVALSYDLVQFYVFWEAMLIPAWFLVLNWNEQPEKAKYISTKFFIITHIGAVLMLSSILWIYSMAGSTNMNEIGSVISSLPAMTLLAVAILFLMGFVVKLAIFPFHTWLPDAYTSPVMPVTLVLVGVVTNIGVYGFARFLPFFKIQSIAHVSSAMLCFAVVTMFYGGFMALVEKNIKRILAYSSISQMGYIFFGFATFVPAGAEGAVFNIFNQAATKLALFMCIGITAYHAGTYDLDRLGGWGKKLPYIAVFATGAMLSLVGAPPALGFWPEFLIFASGFSAGRYTLSFLGLGASLLSVAYALRLIRLVYFGQTRENSETVIINSGWTNTLAVMICFIVILALGIYPNLVFNLVSQAVKEIGPLM